MRLDTAAKRLASRYIPKNALPIEEENGLGVVYVYPSKDFKTQKPKFSAIAYRGTAYKSEWHCGFKTDLELDKYIADWFKSLQERKARVAQWRADANKPHNFKIGDIVTNSWGYDQTNVDWYRVTRTTEHYVWLKPVAASLEQTGFMCGQESLALDQNLKPIDIQNGKETKHKASGDHCTMRYGSGSKHAGGSTYSSWYA